MDISNVSDIYSSLCSGNREYKAKGGAIMHAIEYLDVDAGPILQARELLRTIADAPSALAKLLPDMESKHRFEFA